LQEIPFDGLPKRFAGRKDIVLPDDLVERARAHPLRERRANGGPAVRPASFVIEE
jgi:hypothetical protein